MQVIAVHLKETLLMMIQNQDGPKVKSLKHKLSNCSHLGPAQTTDEPLCAGTHAGIGLIRLLLLLPLSLLCQNKIKLNFNSSSLQWRLAFHGRLIESKVFITILNVSQSNI